MEEVMKKHKLISVIAFITVIFSGCSLINKAADDIKEKMNNLDDNADKIGYIAYTDGTCSEDLDITKTPIGIVCEVTNKKASKIVHLRVSSGVAWCYKTAEGYNMNLPTDKYDGSNNWKFICDTVNDEDAYFSQLYHPDYPMYEAFHYCENLTDGGYKWYLPAAYELKNIIDHKEEIDAGLKKLKNGIIEFDELSYYSYWSSSQFFDEKDTNSIKKAYHIFYKGGNDPTVVTNAEKSSSKTARAVAKF